MVNEEGQKVLLVIGGGAAGVFCAVNAAKAKSLKVVLTEKSSKLLSKVKISGGGRCNVTHACAGIAEMAANYPRGRQFVKKAFHQFFVPDTIKWFESRGVKLKTEADGRMFPLSNSSQTIVDCLLTEARELGVEIRMNAEVKLISSDAKKFTAQLSNGERLNADFVVVACGGYPKSTMFDWLRNLSHTVVEAVPSLFTFNMPKHPIRQLQGISVPNVVVKVQGTKLKEEGPLLITHWGLSGPAILKLSAWGARDLHAKGWHFTIHINWVPDFNEEAFSAQLQALKKDNPRKKITSRNEFGLPERLWLFLMEAAQIDKEKRWADLSGKEQNRLVKQVCAYEAEVKGKTTFKEEFVTAGGIALGEVQVQTMMSKKVEGLYFVGEILDVDGITGGFNFQNAWTTAYIAAEDIKKNARFSQV